MKLILASTSQSRKKILKKLALPFGCVAPQCDETPQANESAIDLVLRLSQIKAQSVAQNYDGTETIIIGSDQVGVLDDLIVGKPHTIENAKQQLLNSSGKTFSFYTGLCVINAKTQQTVTLYEPFKVTFRHLNNAEIESYIKAEMPLQCAGSFKCDELGITLFEKFEGNDINSLVGLPLIRLNQVMIEMGYNPLLMKV